MRLTELAHEAIRRVLKPGEVAIDATMGNGHDTRFLAECVGESGKVFAFDIQAIAIERTAALLNDLGFRNVELLHRSHAEMTQSIPSEYQGTIGAVMFNLGYLPSGDHAICTRAASSVEAVRQAAELLRLDGILSALLYPGHPSGDTEAIAVETRLQELSNFAWVRHIPDRPNAPRLWLGTKIGATDTTGTSSPTGSVSHRSVRTPFD